MTNISPVGPAKDHVQAEDCDAGGIIVLVEDSLKLLVQQGCAFLKTNATWRIKAATLHPETLVLFDYTCHVLVFCED